MVIGEMGLGKVARRVECVCAFVAAMNIFFSFNNNTVFLRSMGRVRRCCGETQSVRTCQKHISAFWIAAFSIKLCLVP